MGSYPAHTLFRMPNLHCTVCSLNSTACLQLYLTSSITLKVQSHHHCSYLIFAIPLPYIRNPIALHAPCHAIP